jgi:hypothetical protein
MLIWQSGYFEEGNDMLKRTLIAVAVIGMLATSVQAAGPDPTLDTAGNERGFKIDPVKMNVFWPYEYKALDLCTIPVRLEIGILVQVNKCPERKINLKQVDCAEIGKGGGDFPCYHDCEDVQIRTNFPIKLGLSKSKVGNVLKDWSAYFDGDDFVDPTGSSWKTITVCVDAWNTQLFNHDASGQAGDWVHVGNVTITVKPNV